MFGWLVMAQAITAIGPPLVVDPRLRAGAPCTRSSEAGEITVCGSTEQPYRLKSDLPKSDELRLPKAEVSALGGKATIETEQVGVGGFPSNRVMLRMKWKF